MTVCEPIEMSGIEDIVLNTQIFILFDRSCIRY